MANKSIDERIEEIERKQAQLQAKAKLLKSKKTEQERKARTKRLIEVGAIIEKCLDMEFKTPEQRQKLLQLLTEEVSLRNGEISTWAKAMRNKLQ